MYIATFTILFYFLAEIIIENLAQFFNCLFGLLIPLFLMLNEYSDSVLILFGSLIVTLLLIIIIPIFIINMAFSKLFIFVFCGYLTFFVLISIIRIRKLDWNFIKNK